MAKKIQALDLYEQAQALIDEHQDRDALYDRLDDLYDQVGNARDAEKPLDVQLVKMPYATNAVDLVTDLASQQELRVEVPAAGETKKAKERADEQEQWLKALKRANEKRQHRNFTGELAWAATQRAQCVLRTLFHPRAGEGDEEAGSGLPVILQVRDPRYVYAQEGVNGTALVVEGWKRQAGEIRRLYPKVLDDELPAESEVEWLEVWTDKYRAYFAHGSPVKVGGKELVPHGYGLIPYAFGMARTTARPGVALRYRPLLAGIEDTLKMVDIWFSVLATAGWASVTNAWGVFTDDDQKALDTTPGSINYFRQNDRVLPIQRGTLPPDFFQLGTLLQIAIQQGTFPAAMYGQLTGQMAGYAINMLNQSGRRPLLPIWHAIEACWEEAFRNAVLICREKVAPLVGEQVPLVVTSKGTADGQQTIIKRQLRLDTQEIGDDFEVLVTLGDPMPADEAANLRMAMEATNARTPLLSVETALRRFGLSDEPTAEIDRILIEAIYRELGKKEAIKLAVERGYAPPAAVQPEPPALGQAPSGQLPPELMAPGVAQQGVPGLPEGVNPALLQAMVGQPQPADLDQLAGAPPAVPAPQGVF